MVRSQHHTIQKRGMLDVNVFVFVFAFGMNAPHIPNFANKFVVQQQLMLITQNIKMLNICFLFSISERDERQIDRIFVKIEHRFTRPKWIHDK